MWPRAAIRKPLSTNPSALRGDNSSPFSTSACASTLWPKPNSNSDTRIQAAPKRGDLLAASRAALSAPRRSLCDCTEYERAIHSLPVVGCGIVSNV